LSEFPGKINYTLKIQKGNAEPDYCRSRFMSRSSRGSSCGLVFGSNSFTILTYISGENGIVANSYGYLSKASLGFSPKLGCALAPYMLLKKRLDLEAPAATTIGEPLGGFKSKVRKTHSLNLSRESR
jgi:hypothetical protein